MHFRLLGRDSFFTLANLPEVELLLRLGTHYRREGATVRRQCPIPESEFVPSITEQRVDGSVVDVTGISTHVVLSVEAGIVSLQVCYSDCSLWMTSHGCWLIKSPSEIVSTMPFPILLRRKVVTLFILPEQTNSLLGFFLSTQSGRIIPLRLFLSALQRYVHCLNDNREMISD